MKASNLLKISSLGLSAEQLTVVLAVLAEELAPLEARREKDRLRKRSGDSAEVPQNVQGSSVEIPRLARDGDIILPSSKENNIPPFPPSEAEEQFQTFFKTYPYRDVETSEEAARKSFFAARKRESFETIMAGTRGYAEFCKATGKTGTKYVKNLRAWLNDGLWVEHMPKTPAAQSVCVVQQGTPEWKAWIAHKQSLGQKTTFLEKLSELTVPSLWPPSKSEAA